MINRFDNKNPLVHTYSVMAYDKEKKEMGIAVQSHWFAVGTVVPWLKAGVGVVSVQSFVNLIYASYGLALMEGDMTPKQALYSLLEKDISPEIRQIIMMDAKGNIEAYTGNKCVPEAGHIVRDGFSVQGNVMMTKDTLERMADRFENTKGGIDVKMLEALKVADKEKGDLRGKQSACMKIVSTEKPKHEWEGILLDIRVDDNKEPINELDRLLNIHKAYQHMNRAEMAFGEKDMEKAFKEYAKAQNLYSDNLELSFWEGVSLANIGKYHDAYSIFYTVFDKEPKWKTFTRRLITAEILNVDIDFIERLFQDDPDIVDEILEENFHRYEEDFDEIL